MNYVSWIDSDGQAHDISEMPTEYIKNCIKCIQNSDYENKTKKDAQRIKNTKFLRHGGVINMLRIILMHLILNYQFENVENVKIILHLL